MSPKNRGDRIQLLHKTVTKHYEPVPAPDDRNVLEDLVYACCLEDARYDAADEAFHRLRESFFDWNEIRVTTITELGESLHNLPDPAAAAVRIKQNLQSLFETRFSFDIDDMVKMNQGKAVQELEALAGMTKFVLGYTTQVALGGHSIPVSKSIQQVLLATEIISEAEAAKGLAPGLERTVPKTKGQAFASCLHQLALDYAESPGSKNVQAIMKEAGATVAKPAKKAPAKSAPAKKAATKSATKKAAAEKPKAEKVPPAKKKATGKKTEPAKKTEKQAPAKKATATKKPAAKKAATSKKASTKKKPR